MLAETNSTQNAELIFDDSTTAKVC